MFVPIPPGPPPRPEADPEPVQAIATWRPRGRWRALLRMSWLCRLLAYLSLGFALLAAIVYLTADWQPSFGSRIVYVVGSLFSGFVAWVVWLGLAELILLAIALERNSRQIRDRLPKDDPNDATVVQREP